MFYGGMMSGTLFIWPFGRRHATRLVCTVLIVSFGFIGAGCERNPAEYEGSIAILKFTRHPALDATENGVMDSLKDNLGEELEDFRIERHNANGNTQLAKQLAESVSTSKTKLIIAIATPAAQAVVNTPSNIPLVYGAVADPEGAGILASGRATGVKNVGENIIKRALGFLRAAFPDASTIGTMYNPAEQNSVYVQKIIADNVDAFGFKLVAREVKDRTQVASTTELLCREADIIYSANDNTINSSMSSVVAITRQLRTPFAIGDLSSLKEGASVAIGLDYYELGVGVGQMSARILNGASLKTVPPAGPPEPAIWVNQPILENAGRSIPAAARSQVDKVIAAE